MALRTLIEAGADLEAVEPNSQRTPLLCAASVGEVEAVSILLAAGAHINAVSPALNTALTLAVGYGHVTTVQVLITAGANLEATNGHGFTALMLAMQPSPNQLEMMNMLIDAGASVNTPGQNKLESCLMLAVNHNNIECIRLLIAAGASLNFMDKFGQTALGNAVKLGRLDCVQLLLESGADVEGSATGEISPLLLAVESKHSQAVELTRLLLQVGASVNAIKSDENQQTALHIAAEREGVEILKLLIQYGANLDVEDGNGGTPLQYATQRGKISAMLVLIQAGALFRSMNASIAAQSSVQANATIGRPLLFSRKANSFRSFFHRLRPQSSNRQDTTAMPSTKWIVQDEELSIADTFCTDICNSLTECSRLRKDFEDARINSESSVDARQAWSDLQQLLQAFQRMDNIAQFLIHPAIRLLCEDLLHWIDEALNRDDIDESCKLQLARNIADYQAQVRQFLHAVPTTTMNSAPLVGGLVLLTYECEHHKSRYTAQEMYGMHKYLQYASRAFHGVIPKVPKWFVPFYHIQFDVGRTWLDGRDSQHGIWSGADVVVEALPSRTSQYFVRDIELQFALKHPHVLNLCGAFHLGNRPLVVYPSHQSLAQYLLSRLDPNNSVFDPLIWQLIWQKFRHISLGLAYLHKKKIAHGNLKHRNLVVDN